jgi:RNA polymerase sigma-70 factor (ECF subfamily)
MDGTGSPVFKMSLADRVREGEQGAEEELVQTFFRKVLVMAQVRVCDPDVALDIAQETMIGVLEALRQGRVRNDEHVAAYVLGAAKNLINNQFRLRARTRREEPALDVEVAQGDPEQLAAEHERLEMVERALSELKPDDREILRMTLVDGMKPGEIAAEIGLTSEVVRQRKSRATRRLQLIIRDLSRIPRPNHKEEDGR